MFEDQDSIFAKKEFVKQYNFCYADEKDNPLNEPHVFDWPEGMEYVLTMKAAGDFECEEAQNIEEEDRKFLPFAMRKSGLTVVKFYETEDQAKTLDRVWYFAPDYQYLFLWNKDGVCVDGAY